MADTLRPIGTLPEGTVTVLFSDVVSSTELPAKVGEGAARALLRDLEDVVRAELSDHGGHEVKSTGDGHMVAFVSARRAVDCAVAIQRAVARAGRVRGRTGLQVRIGLNTGEVIADRGDLFGSAVNAAQRIQASAEPGAIWISGTTRALLGSVPDLTIEDRGEHTLKGFEEPWQLYEVVWDTGDSPSGVGARTEFVGREREMTRLEELVVRADGGCGSMVLLGGEPGVGKTRLCEELASIARERGVLTLVGHCQDAEPRQPYLPFVEMVERSLALVPPRALREALGSSAPEVAKLMPELRRHFGDIPEPVSVAADQERRYLLASIRDFVARASKTTPLMLVFEDLHWADDATLLLVRRLAQDLDQLSVLIVGTFRDVELDLGAPFAHTLQDLLRARLAEEIGLAPLERGDVISMLQHDVTEPPPTPVVSLVFDETEGNPFFVEELVRYLQEAGRLFDEEGHWNTDLALAVDEVPRSVRLVIGRRLERLSDECRQVLMTAAHIGRAFEYDLLSRLSDLDDDRLIDAIEEAERAGVVREVARGRASSYVFAHEQLRQVVLAGVSAPRAQRLHRRIGEALEQRYGGDALLHASEIASHFFDAGAAVDSEVATRYLVAAARAALDALAYEEALWAVEAAQATHSDDDLVGLSQLLRIRALALRGTGRVDDAVASFEEAIELAPPGDEQDTILRERADLYLGLFRSDEAVRDFELLVANARGRRDQAAELEALLGLAYAYYEISLNDADHAEIAFETLERAYHLARVRDDKAAMARSRLRSLAMQGIAGRDDLRAMTATASEAVALAREAADEELILASRSATLLFVGAHDWLEEYENIRNSLEQRADPIALKEHYWHGMWMSRTIGEFELCVTVCDGGIRIADQLGVPPVMYPTIKALALLDLGRFDDALESLAQEVVAEPFGVAMRKLGEAAYFTEVHAFEEGAAATRESLQLADRFRRRWMQEMALGYLVRSLLGEGRRAEASKEYAAVSPPPYEATRSGGRLRGVVRAEVLAAEDDLDEALDEIDRHVERADQLGLRRDLVIGRECRSRLLLVADRHDDAMSEADRCIDDASATGFRAILWRGYTARARARAALGDRRGADDDRTLALGEVRELAASIPDATLAARFVERSGVTGDTG